MDAFIDYLYYLNNGGSSIPESEFDRYALRASYQVDFLTFNRADAIVTAGTNAPLIDRIKRATVAVADVMKSYSVNGGSGAIIQSEKVGDHSVQYRDGEQLRSQETQAVSSVVEMYLSHTGLLYPGVG
jgi:hypothetical protein